MKSFEIEKLQSSSEDSILNKEKLLQIRLSNKICSILNSNFAQKSGKRIFELNLYHNSLDKYCYETNFQFNLKIIQEKFQLWE